MKLSVFIIFISFCHCELSGPNLCTRKETYVVKVTVSVLQPYQVREVSWCISETLRCSKIVTKFRTEFKTQRLTKIRPVLQCCEGYKPNTNQTHCIPNCSKGCEHGICTSPNDCQCLAGYGGVKCDYSCPLGLYGKKCEFECMCKNNSTCNALTGICRCSDGWKGSYCRHICEAGSYGPNCLKKCRCVNGDCHHVSGKCSCHSNWTGEFCDFPIEKETVANKTDCPCLNGGFCKPETKTCICSSGWTGKKCKDKCISGYWGLNCSERCFCSNDANCNYITGECFCPPGFIGPRCSDSCPEGTYGKDCLFDCNCNNHGYCSHINGTCVCSEGWSGTECNLSTNFNNHLFCKCQNNNFICDVDQNCVCREGYEGNNCDIYIGNKKWLLYGGIGLSIFLIICAVGILTTCILFIKFYRRRNKLQLENRTTNNMNTYVPYEQAPLMYTDFKRKEINLYNDELRKRQDHVYEEINDNPSRYDQITFNEYVHPQNVQYQCIKNNLKISNTNINKV